MMTKKYSSRLFGLFVLLLGLSSAAWCADALPGLDAASASLVSTPSGPAISEIPSGSGFDIVGEVTTRGTDMIGGAAGGAGKVFSKTGESLIKNSGGNTKVLTLGAAANEASKFSTAASIAAMIPSAWSVGNSISDCLYALDAGDHDAFVAAFNKAAIETSRTILVTGATMAASAAITALIPGVGPVLAGALTSVIGVIAGYGVEWLFNAIDANSKFSFWADLAWNAYHRKKNKADVSASGSGGGGSSQKMKKLNIGITK